MIKFYDYETYIFLNIIYVDMKDYIVLTSYITTATKY